MTRASILLLGATVLTPLVCSADPPTEKKAPAEVTNSIGMKFVTLPPGTFQMGTPFTEAHRSSDESLHEITLSKPFSLGIHEVSQAEYQRVMGVNPSNFTAARFKELKDTGRFPVEQVSWDDAVAFCEKLGDLPDEKAAGRTYRLPTEAEWEYACREGKSRTPFHFGESLGSTVANIHGKYPYGKAPPGDSLQRTTSVGSYKPNALGLHDMHGNVWEWCADKYDRDYYLNSPARDPTGPRNPERRVARGGSWRNDAARCRSGYRGKYLPDTRLDNLGFRVVLVTAEETK
jgi:formylglycine-generating enzyme required for sulfatase activity